MTGTSSTRAPADLGDLFRPSRVAIVGAGQDPTTVGGRAVSAMQRHGFGGEILPVNPKYDELQGLPCYPSLREVPGDVDVVEILVSAARAAGVMQEAADKGARWAVMLNAGFDEIGGEGSDHQREVSRIAAEAGIRIVGPNCGGIFNFLDGIPLGFLPAFDLEPFRRGPLGIVAQSGGVLTNLLNKAFDWQLGVSYGASTGNEPDLTVMDFVEFMLNDPTTGAVALYTESLRDPDHFVDVCRLALERRKALVVLKGGRSEAGQETAASHTGSLATSHRVLESIAQRYGVCLVDDVDDLLEIGWYLANEDLGTTPPRAVAAVSTSGGTAVMTADALDKAAITLPQPSADTSERIQGSLPAFGISRNPIDITGQYFNDPELFERMITTLEDASEFDAIVVSLGMITKGYAERFAADIERFRQQAKVPLVVVWIGGSMTEGGVDHLRDHGMAVFRRLSSCADGMRAWANFADALERHGAVAQASTRPATTIDLPDQPAFTEEEAIAALTGAGVTLAASRLVRSADEAARAAAELGLPVVMKFSSREVTHKSDRGGVKVGVATEDDVRAAYEELAAIPRGPGDADQAGAVLVQEMVSGGTEFIVGLERDERFGWVLLVGMGGTMAELLNDTAVAPLPVDDAEIRRLLAGLQGYPLLTGFRGAPPADVDALVELVATFTAAAGSLPDDVVSIEMNPVMVRPAGQGALGVDAVIVRRTAGEQMEG